MEKWKDRYRIELPGEELKEKGVRCENRIYYKPHKYMYGCKNMDKKCEKCIRKTNKRLNSKIRTAFCKYKDALKYWYDYYEDIIIPATIVVAAFVIVMGLMYWVTKYVYPLTP